MPMMTLVMRVGEGVMMSTLRAVVSTVSQGWIHRANVDRPAAKRLTAAAYAGMPLGLLVLSVASDRTLRLILGIGVLIATLVLALRLRPPKQARTMDVVMGFVSGVANTSIGTNGPPMVYALQSRGLGPAMFLGTISIVFAFSNVFTVSLFAITGKITTDGLQAAALAFPGWLIGAFIGRRIQPHVSEYRFRQLVLGLLFASGVMTIVGALV